MLTPDTLPALQRSIVEAGVDGWLLFDFHGTNPIAGGMLRLAGMVTRRIFAWVPATGLPVAVTHNIEQGAWREWPSVWPRERYSSWRTLEQTLARLVNGKRVAMEYSPGDAVPYLDRVPAGVIEMVRAAGAEVISSAPLVTTFYASWTGEQLASHERAAALVATIARDALAHAGAAATAGVPAAEHELRRWITDRFVRAGLEFDHPPIVAVNANAANAHYEPSSSNPQSIDRGSMLLVDLWAREPGGVYADQTWVASLGAPSSRAASVWDAVRAGRDAAIDLLRTPAGSAGTLLGAQVDDAARAAIVARGFGEYFTHRTGHSIDSRELHGSGPHIDNFETREVRALVPGVGFSIEPGIYIAGEIGVRSEVNVFMGASGAVITPSDYERDLIVV
ncbi:MAG: M24 family metallopeptidase [Gemmatimonadota bacterium]|nr:M24 family metallopeptidase [Gemmatimonadota bacterium]